MTAEHVVAFAGDVLLHLVMAGLCLGGVYAVLGIVRIALGKRDE